MAHQWRGVVREYADRLPVTEDTRVITLGEGGTPLIHAPHLSELVQGTVHVKFEGMNPTGSFKDRGMTAAISVARHEGAEAVVCASTGNTSASAAAYAALLGDEPSFDVVMLGIGPEGHVASIFPDSPAVHDDRTVVAVRDCPKPPPTRISLTLPTIRTAAQVWIVTAGEGKAQAVATALAGAGELAGAPHSGFWACMDTPKDLAVLEARWSEGAPWRRVIPAHLQVSGIVAAAS